MKKILGYLVCAIYSLMNKFTCKKYVLFYSNLGFRDNIQALFEYYIAHNFKNQKVVVCCSNHRKVKNNYKNYKMVKFASNIFAVHYFIWSKVIFYSFGKIPIVPVDNQITFNLWHGMPLKTIGNKAGLNVKKAYYTYQLVTSEFFIQIFQNAFILKDDSCLILGQPRNDYLFRPNRYHYENYSKVFIWMPTFRKSSKMNYIDIDSNKMLPMVTFNDLKTIDNLMKAHNSILVIKIHPLQDLCNEFDFSLFSNIVVYSQKKIDEENINLYCFLGASDCLITDYSSVYIDYLLLDKPIGFTIDDFEEYNNNRGTMFDDPLSKMPGMKIKNIEDFICFIKSVFENNDFFSEERKKISELFNKFNDANSSKRIIYYLKI